MLNIAIARQVLGVFVYRRFSFSQISKAFVAVVAAVALAGCEENPAKVLGDTWASNRDAPLLVKSAVGEGGKTQVVPIQTPRLELLSVARTSAKADVTFAQSERLDRRVQLRLESYATPSVLTALGVSKLNSIDFNSPVIQQLVASLPVARTGFRVIEDSGQFVLGDLLPNTVYRMSARACSEQITDKTCSSFGSYRYFATWPPSLDSTRHQLTVVPTLTLAEIAWEPTIGADYYKLYRRDISAGSANFKLLNAAVTTFSYSDKTVIPGSTYFYRLEPCQASYAQEIACSSVVYTDQQTSIPNLPQVQVVAAGGFEEVTVIYTTLNTKELPLYQLQRCDSAYQNCRDISYIDENTQERQQDYRFNDTNLKSDTTYYYRQRACTDKQSSLCTSWSLAQAKTLQNDSLSVKDFKLVSRTPTTLDLKWSYTGSQVSDKFVVYYEAEGTEQSQSVAIKTDPRTERTYSLTGLQPDTRYKLRVSHCVASGVCGASNTIFERTLKDMSVYDHKGKVDSATGESLNPNAINPPTVVDLDADTITFAAVAPDGTEHVFDILDKNGKPVVQGTTKKQLASLIPKLDITSSPYKVESKLCQELVTPKNCSGLTVQFFSLQPSPVKISGSVVAINPLIADINYTLTSPTEGVTSYKISWKPINGSSFSPVEEVPASRASGVLSKKLYTNAIDGNTVKFVLKAQACVGTKCSVEQQTTVEGEKKVFDYDLTAVVSTVPQSGSSDRPYQARLAWDDMKVDYYRVSYIGSNGREVILDGNLAGTTTNFTDSPLGKGEERTYKVVGCLRSSQCTPAITKKAVTPNPGASILTVGEVDSTKASVVWKLQGNTSSTRYKVFLRTKGFSTFGLVEDRQRVNNPGDTLGYTFTNLTPGKDYEVRIEDCYQSLCIASNTVSIYTPLDLGNKSADVLSLTRDTIAFNQNAPLGAQHVYTIYDKNNNKVVGPNTMEQARGTFSPPLSFKGSAYTVENKLCDKRRTDVCGSVSTKQFAIVPTIDSATVRADVGTLQNAQLLYQLQGPAETNKYLLAWRSMPQGNWSNDISFNSGSGVLSGRLPYNKSGYQVRVRACVDNNCSQPRIEDVAGVTLPLPDVDSQNASVRADRNNSNNDEMSITASGRSNDKLPIKKFEVEWRPQNGSYSRVSFPVEANTNKITNQVIADLPRSKDGYQVRLRACLDTTTNFCGAWSSETRVAPASLSLNKVALQPLSSTLNVADTRQIAASCLANNSPSYESKLTNVVTVNSSGVVTALAKGQATVVVTCNAVGAYKKDQKSLVFVVNPTPNSVRLNTSTLNVKVNETKGIGASCIVGVPSYASSNTNTRLRSTPALGK